MVASCGSDSTTDPDNPPADTTVHGVVVKGPVAAAQVEIRTMAGDGMPGDLVAGPVATNVDGEWTLVIPGTRDGDLFLVTAKGGDYDDEATGDPVTIPATAEMIGCVDRRTPNSVVVTPFTHMLYLMARGITGPVSAGRAWELTLANAAANGSFGFNLTTTIPAADAGASPAAKSYAAMLGGLSALPQLDQDYDAISGANPYNKVMAVVRDITDGSLDGMVNGAAILVPVTEDGSQTAPLPLISSQGVRRLGEWAQSFAGSVPGLADAVVPADLAIVPAAPIPATYPCDQIADVRAAAYASLANTMWATLTGPDPDAPRDVDFSTCRGLYQAVLSCDSSDPEANFALALLDLSALAIDSEVNDAFDAWRAYLDEVVPFETDAPTASLGMPTTLTRPSDAMELPFAAIQRSLLPALHLQKAVAPPQIEQVQAIFRDRVLPKVQTGVAKLDIVIADPSYTFTISPRMQGDLLEEYREADQTDFLALRAAMKALAAGLHVAVAYRLNFDDYTGDVLLATMNQASGDLLTLLGDGAAHMQMVPTLLSGAVLDLDAAIDALRAETDSQTDDLIKIGPTDLHEADLIDFQANELQMIGDSLAGPVTRTYDWDFEPGTPDVAMTVDLGAFFSTPVVDLKDLLPPYTLSIEVVPYEVDYHWDSEIRTVSVTVPAAGNYYGDCGLGYSDGILSYSYCNGPAWATNAIQALIDAEAASIIQLPGWTGYLSLSAYFGGNLIAGPQSLYVDFHVSYDVGSSFVEVGRATFAADTYAQWLAQWPDPTLGGLFPNVTDAAEVAAAFGMLEEDWAKEFSLDWADYGFGFDRPYVPTPPPGR